MIIVASIPAIYVSSLLIVLRALSGLIFLPGALLTALLPILMVATRSRVPLAVSIAALAVSIVGLSALLQAEDPHRMLLPIIAAAPQLALFGCWIVFLPVMTRIGGDYERERRRALDATVTAAVQAAVTEAQGRWINAGAWAAADLLRAIAAGTADAADPEVRRRCADEERYLRQLLSFDAGLLHLSPWLALGLAQARAT